MSRPSFLLLHGKGPSPYLAVTALVVLTTSSDSCPPAAEPPDGGAETDGAPVDPGRDDGGPVAPGGDGGPVEPGGDGGAVEPGDDGGAVEPGDGGPVEPGDGGDGRVDEMALWDNETGPHLRGANIWLSRQTDGDIRGPGNIGPPFVQADFDELAALGANVVFISHTGLYREEPPYDLDLEVQGNLDGLVEMIGRANMYAVIAFRTGPGRNEYVFQNEESPGWLGESRDVNTLWSSAHEQDLWVAMWRHTAARYRDDPAVVGYTLMVEPNASDMIARVHDPALWPGHRAGTLIDWNQLHPRITAAIREVDPETPVLVECESWGWPHFMPTMVPNGDPRAVYVFHQYAPKAYTHQTTTVPYPGWMDVDRDGDSEAFDRSALEDILRPVDGFAALHGVAVGCGEFGAYRWAADYGAYLTDLFDVFDERGVNSAIWVWNPSFEPWASRIDNFDFMHGPDRSNRTLDVDSPARRAIEAAWSANVARPYP